VLSSFINPPKFFRKKATDGWVKIFSMVKKCLIKAEKLVKNKQKKRKSAHNTVKFDEY
jgi:hypothetical protein